MVKKKKTKPPKKEDINKLKKNGMEIIKDFNEMDIPIDKSVIEKTHNQIIEDILDDDETIFDEFNDYLDRLEKK